LDGVENYSNLSDNEKEKILIMNVEAILSSEASKFLAIYEPKQKQKEIILPSTVNFCF
jgi:hypothetical protein